MKRVAIVGSGGVGKSTFADELGRRTGIPVVHLDQRFWKPGWVETPRDAWIDVQREIVAQDSWIVDGNYGGTFNVRFERADTVIILTLPRWRCVFRACGGHFAISGTTSRLPVVVNGSTSRSIGGCGATPSTAAHDLMPRSRSTVDTLPSSS
jgi:adenylate kinase family enzyme